MHRQYAHLHGRTISYFDSAHTDSQARVLLLMHAFPLGAGMWEGQVKALPPGWRIIAPDVRGFGGSTIDDPDDTPRLDDYARDAIDLLHELGITTAVVGGLSMGGYVALAIARRQPSVVAALLLADSRATADTPEGRANRRGMLALVEREGPSGVSRDMMPKLLGETTRASRPTVEPLVRRLIKQQSPAAIRGAIFRMMERPDSLDVLQSLTVPVSIIVGDEDVLTPVNDSRQMHAAAHGSELVVMPQTGHLSNLERPDLFNQIVHGFLARL
jgi:pimeloyl-ACP methyl ester carboxylesterase